ncbi:MAG TPA: YihY/virulence factor BrkB family protein [Allosphingosinicella sp.]|nr:YihY/virulence factor BrkB family protein [Allosphingosinicella sp.]
MEPQMHEDRGTHAESPAAIPPAGWKDVLRRTWNESWTDNLGLVAAGVAFYGFLALVPMLGAIVLLYGLFAEPSTVISNMQALTDILPDDVAVFIGQQLMDVVRTSEEKKGWGLLAAGLVALYGGANGAGAVITALNVAYEEQEKRSLLRFYTVAVTIAVIAVLLALAALAATTAVAALGKLMPNASSLAVAFGKGAAYLVLTLAAAAVAATLYRFAPSRDHAQWKWLTPGSLFTAISWVLFTLAFGFYVTEVTDYNATYGSLGAIIALLTWMYLTSYVFVFGAELNRELEHQTEKDTTVGRPEPMGKRGAWAADHVAGEREEKSASDEEEVESIARVWPDEEPEPEGAEER